MLTLAQADVILNEAALLTVRPDVLSGELVQRQQSRYLAEERACYVRETSTYKIAAIIKAILCTTC